MKHHWVRHFVADFETNPKFQLRFHFVAMVFWTLNAFVALGIFLWLPHLWLRIAVLYVLLLSLYANWDTDYGAISAALAAVQGEQMLARGETARVVGSVVAVEVKPEGTPDPSTP